MEEWSNKIRIFIAMFIVFLAIGVMKIVSMSVQHGYIVSNYDTEKIVATVKCKEKKVVPIYPPYVDEKRTTFLYNGVEIESTSDEIYYECEKGSTYQAIIEIETPKKNGKKLYSLMDIADTPKMES